MVLLEVVLSALATFHVLAAAVASMLPLVVAGIRCTAVSRPSGADTLLRSLAWLSLQCLVAAAVVGLATGYLRYTLGDPDYGHMLARFPLKYYVHTGIEWLFSLICLSLWYASWKWGSRHPLWHLVLVVVGTTNLLYHFPPLMVLQRILVERPDIVAEATITRATTLEAIASGEVIAHTLHFYALATGISSALMLAAIAKLPLPERTSVRRFSGWSGFASTAGQILTGIAIVVFAPGAATIKLAGGNWLPSLALGATVGVSLALLWNYGDVAIRDRPARSLRRPLHFTIVATFLMVLAARSAP